MRKAFKVFLFKKLKKKSKSIPSMKRVFKDDDVSRSSLSSGQLDGQAVGLAARVDHHHLQGEVWFGGWMVMVGKL